MQIAEHENSPPVNPHVGAGAAAFQRQTVNSRGTQTLAPRRRPSGVPGRSSFAAGWCGCLLFGRGGGDPEEALLSAALSEMPHGCGFPCVGRKRRMVAVVTITATDGPAGVMGRNAAGQDPAMVARPRCRPRGGRKFAAGSATLRAADILQLITGRTMKVLHRANSVTKEVRLRSQLSMPEGRWSGSAVSRCRRASPGRAPVTHADSGATGQSAPARRPRSPSVRAARRIPRRPRGMAVVEAPGAQSVIRNTVRLKTWVDHAAAVATPAREIANAVLPPQSRPTAGCRRGDGGVENRARARRDPRRGWRVCCAGARP